MMFLDVFLYFVPKGDLMNNKNNDEKKRLEVLERFLGFLGVMIALAMTLAWDFINSSKFETISKQDQVVLMYCILSVF